MSEELRWWGYIHQNGKFHLKRYFSHADIDDASESPFVMEVFGPVYAETKEDAEMYLAIGNPWSKPGEKDD